MEDGISQFYKDEQARHLAKAIDLPLPDAVFVIIHYNDHQRQMGPRPHCDPIDISVLYDHYDPNEVEEWRVKAQKLRQNAYAIGDVFLRKDGTYDRLRQEHEAAHPGFMPETYEDAARFGMYQAR
jgi:hypothetical protein